jgi:hypothetical protein
MALRSRSLAGSAILLLSAAAVGAAGLGGKRFEPDPEQWRVYQQALLRLTTNRPADEFLLVSKHNDTIFREVDLWVRAEPRKGNETRRVVHCYLDDGTGHPVRSVPNEVAVEVTAPGRLEGTPALALRDSRGSFTVLFSAGASSAKTTVAAVPYGARIVWELPLVGSRRDPVVRPLPTPFSPITEAQASQLLTFARQVARKPGIANQGRAGRWGLQRALAYLKAGELAKGEEALRLAAEEFSESPATAVTEWMRCQVLRRTGRAKESAPIAARLRARWPNSLPLEFLAPLDAGETWVTPYDSALARVAEKAAGTR